eukprot:scaffold648041_cov31-Prasinocladus_malaysianus.AAC.2
MLPGGMYPGPEGLELFTQDRLDGRHRRRGALVGQAFGSLHQRALRGGPRGGGQLLPVAPLVGGCVGRGADFELRELVIAKIIGFPRRPIALTTDGYTV